MAVVSDSAVLRDAQEQFGSDVPTNSLLFPECLGRDVAFRLETARLVINARGWLGVPLEPILAEDANPKEMWQPDLLENQIRNACLSQTEPVMIRDYLNDYKALYKSLTFSIGKENAKEAKATIAPSTPRLSRKLPTPPSTRTKDQVDVTLRVNGDVNDEFVLTVHKEATLYDLQMYLVPVFAETTRTHQVYLEEVCENMWEQPFTGSFPSIYTLRCEPLRDTARHDKQLYAKRRGFDYAEDLRQ